MMNSLLMQAQLQTAYQQSPKRYATTLEMEACAVNAVDPQKSYKTDCAPQSKIQTAALKNYMPDDIANKDYKILRLVELLNDLCLSKNRSDHVKEIVLVIRELNLMQGHYAPAKHLLATASANLTSEQSQRINSLIDAYSNQF